MTQARNARSLEDVAYLAGRIGWKGLTAKEYTKTGPFLLSVHSLNYGDSVDYRDAFHISQERYDESPEIMLQKNDILICKDGAGIGKLGIVEQLEGPTTINSSMLLIRPNKGVVAKYLYHCLCSPFFQQIVKEKIDGATTPHLYQRDLRQFPVHIPAVAEQERVVSILDDAFEGIRKAHLSVENNLAKIRELFENSIDALFLKRGKHWSEKKLEDIAHLAGRIGWKGLTAKEYTKEGPLFVSVHSLNYGDYVDFRDAFHISQDRYDESPEIKLQSNDILICKDGAGIGKMGIVRDLPGPATINSSLLLVRSLKGIDPKFLYYALCSQSFQGLIKEKIDGATTPHLYQRDIRQFYIPIPPLSEQKEIVKRLDKINHETLSLESLYERKRVALVELKQSLLQTAFEGERRVNNVIPFKRASSGSVSVIETASPEFAGHILAYGYHWHEAQNRNKTYGHVKGQKLLQLTESVAKVELGRRPIKDAAGPNDFPHMLRAKEWAKIQKFFEFAPRQTGNGYDFKKLSNYNRLIGASLSLVKPYKQKLDKILALLLPLNTQDAEVLATVHAAWNNLILDKARITEDAIVFEARNNWHSSKMKIPEDAFRKAIALIRKNGIIPDGSAKRVTGQENLF